MGVYTMPVRELTQLCRWQGTVEYTRLNGSTLTVPFCNVIHFVADGKIANYNIYIDNSKLYEV